MGKFPPTKSSFAISTDKYATVGTTRLPPETTANTSLSQEISKATLNVVTITDNVLDNQTLSVGDLVQKIASGASVVVPLNESKVTAASTALATFTKETIKSVSTDSKKKATGSASSVGNVSKYQTKAHEAIKDATNDTMLGLTDHVDVSNETFTVFERITGLSQERPEVIQMMNYLPLFEGQVGASGYHTSDPLMASKMGIESSADFGFTSAGMLFDTLYKHRLIKLNNKNIAYNSAFGKKRNFKKNNEFDKTLADTISIIRTLFGLIQMGGTLKTVLGVRDSQCNLQKTFLLLEKGELRKSSDEAEQDLRMYDNVAGSTTMSPQVANSTLSIPQILSGFGYQLDAAKNVFSSTKLWMQLLFELRTMLRFSSDHLLNASLQRQATDVDPLVINKHTVQTVKLGGKPINYVIPAYKSIMSLVGLNSNDAIDSLVMTLVSAHSDVYRNVSFANTETKIAALANFLSQEYRYTYALRQPQFRNILTNEYGFTVVVPGDDGSNNLGFIDAVIGEIPNNVTDIVTDNSSQSLVSVAQQVISNSDNSYTITRRAILPFEMRYLETGNSTYTPGGSYLVDEALTTDNGIDFNTKGLKDYYDIVSQMLKAFIPVTLACDMYMFGSVSPNGTPKTSNNGMLASSAETPQERKTFGDPRNLYATLFRKMAPVSSADADNSLSIGVQNNTFDGFGNDSSSHDNGIWSIFSYAAKNPRILALLFIIAGSSQVPPMVDGTSLKMTDRKPIIDALIYELEKNFSKTVESSSTSVKTHLNDNVLSMYSDTEQTRTLDEASLRAELYSGEVINFIGKIFTQMTGMTRHLLGKLSRTHYSGMPETLFNFMIFDLMCTMIDAFGKVHLKNVVPASSHSSNVMFQYTLRTLTKNTSITNVYTRLESERARVETALLGVTSYVTELSFGLKTFLSALTPTVKTQQQLDVNTYATLGPQVLRKVNELFNDPFLVNLLLSEQQLMTSLHGTYETMAKFNSARDSGVDFAVLDDIVDDPDKSVLLDTLYSIFSSEDFKSKSGYNKRIISVGLPTGFSHNFKHRKSNARKDANDNNSREYSSKVNDVFKIVVRKIDVRYNEIVYKPISFLFDLSRYPARSSKLVRNLNKNITMSNLASCIATCDYSSLNPMNLVPTHPDYLSQESFKNYPFLTKEQCEQLYRNHVMSYLLEVYVRVMTGLNVCENAFSFRTNFVPKMNEETVGTMMSAISGVGASNASTGSSKNGRGLSVIVGANRSSKSSQKSSDVANPHEQGQTSVMENITSIVAATKNVNAAGILLGQLSEFSRTFSTLSSDVYTKQRLLLPKHFERVFSIIIDPDVFEIDVTSTKATSIGSQALDALLSQGELELKKVHSNEKGVEDSIQYVSREKSPGDVSFEKYIVNIESFEDDGV